MQSTSTKKADKAREIAQAALDHFTQKGFLATSLEKIAAAAGVGKSTIYEYFKNKEELFAAAVKEAVEQWLDEINEIVRQTKDPIERLELIAYSFMDCKDTPPQGSQRFYFEILMQTILEGGVFYERKHFIHQVHQKIIRTVADIILEGVSRGQLKPGIARDAKKIAINFLSFLDGMALNSLVADDYINVRDQVAFFFRHLSPMLRVEGQPAARIESLNLISRPTDG